MRWLLLAVGLGQLVLGLLLCLTPGFFHDSIGPYGARNDHYMADVATWYLALGAVALVTALAPAGRHGMRVFVAGATGAIARPLLESLLAAVHARASRDAPR